MHKLNEEKGKGGKGRSRGQEIWIERPAFPRFDGNQENWMAFRRVFKETQKNLELRPVLKMAEEAKRLTTGVKEPVEAWRLRDKRYRDRHIVILLAKHKLQSVRDPCMIRRKP